MSPQRGDSNEQAHPIYHFRYEKRTSHCPNSAAMEFFFQGTQERVRKSLVNEPSVFKPLKSYCIRNLNNNFYVLRQTQEQKLCLGTVSNKSLAGGLYAVVNGHNPRPGSVAVYKRRRYSVR